MPDAVESAVVAGGSGSAAVDAVAAVGAENVVDAESAVHVGEAVGHAVVVAAGDTGPGNAKRQLTSWPYWHRSGRSQQQAAYLP